MKELHGKEVSPQLLQQFVNIGSHGKHHLDSESKMKLVAWVEIAESSAMEKALRQGQSLELRAKVVSRLQEAMGFDLAASRLKSRTVLPQSLQEQRDALVARAKSFVDEHLHFEVYGKAESLQDAIDRVPLDWRKPGELNKSHRLFVVSATLLFEGEKNPWAVASRSEWSKSQLKEFGSILKTVKQAASLDGELYLQPSLSSSCKLSLPCSGAGNLNVSQLVTGH